MKKEVEEDLGREGDPLCPLSTMSVFLVQGERGTECGLVTCMLPGSGGMGWVGGWPFLSSLWLLLMPGIFSLSVFPHHLKEVLEAAQFYSPSRQSI